MGMGMTMVRRMVVIVLEHGPRHAAVVGESKGQCPTPPFPVSSRMAPSLTGKRKPGGLVNGGESASTG